MRAPRAAATALALGLGLGVALSGCGGSSGPSDHPTSATSTTSTSTSTGSGTTTSGAHHPAPLDVAPRRPSTRSEIRFSFTAPTATGRHGAQEIGYSLSVTGPAGARCVGAHEASAGAVRAGARATIVDGPRRTGRAWCAGRYTARVLELARAHCASGSPCPQYVRVQATVATAAFAIAAG